MLNLDSIMGAHNSYAHSAPLVQTERILRLWYKGFRFRIRSDPVFKLWIWIRFQYPDPGSRIRIQILGAKVYRNCSKSYFTKKKT